MNAFSSFNIHHAAKITFGRHDPSNGNAVSLTIEGEGFSFDLAIFDLPRSEIEKIYSGFGKPRDFMTSLKLKEMQEKDPEAFV